MERVLINVKGLKLFLSGPMIGIRDWNAATFAVAHMRLRDAGAAYVYNPALRSATMGGRRRERMDHEQWMVDSLHELTDREKRTQGWEDVIPRKYDLVVQLPGWEQSDGAIAEAQVAHACGIPCIGIMEVAGVEWADML